MKIALFPRLILLVFTFIVLSNPLNAAENTPSSNIQVRPVTELEPITPENVHRLERVGIIGTGNVNGEGAAWSPDGTALAVPSSLGIWLYDAGDWSLEPRYILNEPAAVHYLAYTSDGRFLIAATNQGLQFRLVEEDYRVLQTFPLNLLIWMGFTLSPNDRYLVIPPGGNVPESTLWQIDYSDSIELTRIAEFSPADAYGVFSPVFSPDSSRLMLISDSAIELTVDTTTGMPVTNEYEPDEAFGEIIFSPDGELIAYTAEGFVIVVETATGKPIQRLEIPPVSSPPGEKTIIENIDFMPDSSRLLVLQEDTREDVYWQRNTPTLWDARSGTRLLEYPPVIGKQLLINPNMTGFFSGNLSAYEVTRFAEQDQPVSVPFTQFEMNQLDVSPQGDLLFGYDYGYHSPVWGQFLDWQQKTYIGTPGYGVISDDNHWLIVLDDRTSNVSVLYQPEQVLTRTIGHNGHISSMDIQPRTTRFATATSNTRGGEGGSIRIFDWLDETFLDVLPDQGGIIAEIEYNPAGTLLASHHVCQDYPGYFKYPCSSERMGIYLWKTDSYRLPIRIDTTLPDASGGIAFTPDGQSLLIPDCEPLAGQEVCARESRQGMMRLVDVETLDTLYAIPDLITQPVFSPSGALIAGIKHDTDMDGQFSVWNGKTGDLLARVPAHRFSVADVAFSPDGYFIYSGSRASGNDGEYNVIWVWGVTSNP